MTDNPSLSERVDALARRLKEAREEELAEVREEEDKQGRLA